MKAFILAAGFGKRMGALTRNRPKPLLPVGGYPLLCYTLFQLYLWKVDSVVLNLHYLGEQIEEYLRDFPHFPVRFSREKEILGTSGGVRFALDSFFPEDESFILINPDLIFLPEPSDRPVALSLPDQKFAGCLFLKPRSPDSRERGWVLESGNNRSFIESSPIRFAPDGGDYYYTGYSILNTEFLRKLVAGESGEFGPLWVEQARKGLLLGRVFQGDMLESGKLDDYKLIRNRFPVAENLLAEWEIFLRGWNAKI